MALNILNALKHMVISNIQVEQIVAIKKSAINIQFLKAQARFQAFHTYGTPLPRMICIHSQQNKSSVIRRYTNGNIPINNPPLPRIFYFQNPFTWIVNKFDLKVLEKAWDPTFNERDFIRGSKQAVSKVTQLVMEKRMEELHGLLTKTARASLDADMRQPGSEKVIPIIGLVSDNIKVAAPRRVRFLKYEDRKFCDVDMMFVAIKWLSSGQPSDGLLYLEIFSSFRREYTQYSIPEWTIAYFKIIKLNILEH